MTWIKGQIISRGYPNAVTLPKKTGAAITRGEVVTLDKSSYNWRTAVSTDIEPFGIALKDAASADTFVNDVLIGDDFIGTVSAAGAINPNTYVKCAAAGEVVAWVQGTDAVNLRVGEYLGTEGHMDGKTAVVAAADNDVIAVRLVT